MQSLPLPHPLSLYFLLFTPILGYIHNSVLYQVAFKNPTSRPANQLQKKMRGDWGKRRKLRATMKEVYVLPVSQHVYDEVKKVFVSTDATKAMTPNTAGPVTLSPQASSTKPHVQALTPKESLAQLIAINSRNTSSSEVRTHRSTCWTEGDCIRRQGK